MPNLHLVPNVPGSGRPRAPRGMPANQAAEWRTIVASMPDHHFTSGVSLKMLERLVQHLASAEDINPKIDAALAAGNWKLLDKLTEIRARESTVIGEYAARLRLCPRARWQAEKVSTKTDKTPSPSRPW